jgi:hypothetical protein
MRPIAADETKKKKKNYIHVSDTLGEGCNDDAEISICENDCSFRSFGLSFKQQRDAASCMMCHTL